MSLLDKFDDTDFNSDTQSTLTDDLDDFSFEDESVEESNNDIDVQQEISEDEQYIEEAQQRDDELTEEEANEQINTEEKSKVRAKTSLDISSLKKKLLVKLGKAEEETEEQKPLGPPKELVLYLIMDKINATTLEYFRAYGIKVSKIFTNIKEAQDVVLMQIDPFKLVIVDTGTGRFSSMGSRKELADTISLCEESIDIFYTDTAIKSELSNYNSIQKKNVFWEVYKSTADILARLLSLHDYETYVYDEYDTDDIKHITADILNFNGLTSAAKLDENKFGLSLTVDDIKKHIENEDDEENMLESYVIRV